MGIVTQDNKGGIPKGLRGVKSVVLEKNIIFHTTSAWILLARMQNMPWGNLSLFPHGDFSLQLGKTLLNKHSVPLV